MPIMPANPQLPPPTSGGVLRLKTLPEAGGQELLAISLGGGEPVSFEGNYPRGNKGDSTGAGLNCPDASGWAIKQGAQRVSISSPAGGTDVGLEVRAGDLCPNGVGNQLIPASDRPRRFAPIGSKVRP